MRMLITSLMIVVTGGVGVSAQAVTEEQQVKRIRAFGVFISDETGELVRQNIVNQCEMYHPNDFVLQRTCRNQQSQASNQLQEIWPEVSTNIIGAFAQCLFNQVDDILIDWSILHQCTLAQLEAWRALR